MNTTVQVDYKTEDGTASSEGDYIEAVGTLTFGPGETQKMVTLEVTYIILLSYTADSLILN